MARAVASFPSKTCFAAIASLLVVFGLSGCIGNSVFDDLNTMQPVGSAFNEAQFKDYSFLARSFGTQSAPAGQAFDAEGAISLTGADNTISGLANAYAQKALAAGRAEDVLPEPAPDGDADAENVRLELLRDLDQGRDKAPDDAARAQADYDCWIMNRRIDTLTAAAQACRRSATASLAKLERELSPGADTSAPAPSQPAPSESAPTAPPPTAPIASAPIPGPAPSMAGQAVQFEITFAPRSAKIPLDQIAVISQAIGTARSGHQSHIAVVGHSDGAENSRELSLRRADAVEAALVQQGARPEAIAVSGVGKADPSDASEPKSAKKRRAVITLVP